MNGLLRKVFDRVGCKRLTAVEIDPKRSHQHEIHGTKSLKDIFGVPKDKHPMPAVLLWVERPQSAVTDDELQVTWYDSRAKKPKRHPEKRLYFARNNVMPLAQAGDLLIVARRHDGTVYLIIAPAGGTAEMQLLALFGLPDPETPRPFSKPVRRVPVDDPEEVCDYIIQLFKDALRLNSLDESPSYLEQMRARFGDRLPSPRAFSAFARETAGSTENLDDDEKLIRWLTHEDIIYRQFEEFLIEARFSRGFTPSDSAPADSFLQMVRSLQSRREFRTGWALEQHFTFLLDTADLHHARGTRVEGGEGLQDVLFPGIQEVMLSEFPEEYLTRLSVMASCSGSWRQALAGRNRIPLNHLLTLEPALLDEETVAMTQASVRLVVPRPLHSSYRRPQRANIMSVREFLALVSERQQQAGKNPEG